MVHVIDIKRIKKITNKNHYGAIKLPDKHEIPDDSSTNRTAKTETFPTQSRKVQSNEPRTE
jgi:hypothetical protein